MKKKLWIILGLPVVALIVTACASSRSSYETAPYKVVRTEGDFEIREYPELRIATTERGKDNDGFMRLFRYISGGNVAQEKIAMTTPVFMVGDKMAFVVPAKHTASPPAPTSAAVKVDTLKAQRVAVLRYSGTRSASGESKALAKLQAWMQQHKLQPHGQPFSAYYDPPWTPGFMRRNELLVPVK